MEQNCKMCGSKWTSNIKSKKCPFCGNIIECDNEIQNSIGKILNYIVSIKGLEVLNDKNIVVSYVMDIYKGNDKDKKLFRTACNNGLLEYIYQIYSTNDNQQIDSLMLKAIKMLQDEAFLSYECSKYIVDVSCQPKCLSDNINLENVMEDVPIENVEEVPQKVYLFTEGDVYKRNEFGKKGASFCQLTQMGFPIPQGIIIESSECNNFYSNECKLSDSLKNEVKVKLNKLELVIGKEFGSDNNPLFLAIRCSPRIDVDGTLDAIKNIGINDKIVDQLTKKTNSTWALEIYCDFIIDFSNKVFEIANKHFASVILKINDLKSKNSLTIEFLKECYRELKNIFFDLVGEEFPQDPYNQLFLGLSAAFSSWDSPVSNVYRKMNDLPFKWGMALIVEETVYGNINELSGVGKCIISSDTNELKILYKHNTLSLNEDDKFEVLDETNVNYLKILSERCKKLVLVDNYIIELDFVIKNGFMYIVGYKLQ